MFNNVNTLAPGVNGEAHILCVYTGIYLGIWLGILRTASTQLGKEMVVYLGMGRITIGLARYRSVHVYHLDTSYRIYEER